MTLNRPKVLVSGGAGYIGSHVVKALGKRGADVLVYDNLSTGHREHVVHGSLVVGDLADTDLLRKTVIDFKPDMVIHFAASIQVGESMQIPFSYYQNNTVNTMGLLKIISEDGPGNLIFSSTAAVYGIPEKMPAYEDSPLAPINPYGTSKLMSETIMAELSELSKLNYIALRYFNVAGADPEGELGQKYEYATHLITRALKTAKGEFDKLQVFGTDYDTPDGTCIRDYIHIMDLADAHVLAMDRLLDTGKSATYNVGYGKGSSVREVIDTAKKVTGIDFTVVETGRRDGDPPELIAGADKIRNELNWVPKHDKLEFIVDTAWKWEKSLG